MRRHLCLTSSLPVPRDQVFTALTDYGRIHEWVEGLSGSRILAREHDIAVAQLDLGGRDEPVLLEVVETRPEQLSFAQVDCFRGEGIAGSVSLQADGDHTELVFDLRLPVPLLALRRVAALRDTIDGAADRLQRRLTGDDDAGDDDGVVLLEVVREGGRLEVRLLGENLQLTPPESP